MMLMCIVLHTQWDKKKEQQPAHAAPVMIFGIIMVLFVVSDIFDAFVGDVCCAYFSVSQGYLFVTAILARVICIARCLLMCIL